MHARANCPNRAIQQPRSVLVTFLFQLAKHDGITVMIRQLAYGSVQRGRPLIVNQITKDVVRRDRVFFGSNARLRHTTRTRFRTMP